MKKLTRKALLGIVLALIMVLGIPATMNEAEARTSRLDFADPNEEDEVTIYLTADQMYKPYTLTESMSMIVILWQNWAQERL